jgi:hypothetical protein
MSGAKIFVYGFPTLYGGAGTELHHQLRLWRTLDLEVHIIPSAPGYMSEKLFPELVANNIVVHDCNEFEVIDKGAPVFGFCSVAFLDRIDDIRAHSTNTVFVNCMTLLFEGERRRMAEGKIRAFLYQNDDIRLANAPLLQALNTDAETYFLSFKPYFDASLFPFIGYRSDQWFGCGRISRREREKYASNTLHIYDSFVSPMPKRGLFLGFDASCEGKIGKPDDWIRVANQNECTQQEFYSFCEIVLQPADLTENWPRVGFEAMASGSILIVDNRGGWRRQISHGLTGWLCNDERDFIYYASKMAHEPELRLEMASRARERIEELGGYDVAKESWEDVFKIIL